MEELRNKLMALDGKGYKSYKTIKGSYRFSEYTLSIDHVQGDPFATPSRISIRLEADYAGLPDTLCTNPVRRLALEDFLARSVAHAIHEHVQGNRGSGCSGEIHIAVSGQEVLKRNAVILLDEGKSGLEARLTLGLPADNRRAAGQDALAMLFEELPAVVKHGLCFSNLDAEAARHHVECVEDQDSLRRWLENEKRVAFIADGALLPRASGVDDRPLSEGAVSFESPPELAHTITLPNAGKIRGMVIPEGITLIVGGGFHGKSTVLHALERGVYNHVPGDGREYSASRDNAVKIRAEDGRRIAKVNISPFIRNLPLGRDTTAFSTDNASGSTSQAANIIEALECGAGVLLIDEDTSATNFMIRDQRMQALVAREKEPITPLIHRIRDLHEQHGVSSVIVMGGSGDYLDIADTVIMMDNYQARDVTRQARDLARPVTLPGGESPPAFDFHTARRPRPEALDPGRGNRAVKINSRGVHELLYGEHRIDLAQVEQLVDIGQTECIGLMIHYYAQHFAEDCDNLVHGLKQVIQAAREQGLDVFSPYKVGHLALPRLFELAAAINRIREGDWYI